MPCSSAGDGVQPSNGFGEGHLLLRSLAKKGLQLGQHRDGAVQQRVGAFAVGADADEVFRAGVGRQQRPQLELRVRCSRAATAGISRLRLSRMAIGG